MPARGSSLYLCAARAARELGATLLVGVNTTTSARRLAKGLDRPLNREDDRLSVLAALASVSYGAGTRSQFRSSLGIQLQRWWSGSEMGTDARCGSHRSIYHGMLRVKSTSARETT